MVKTQVQVTDEVFVMGSLLFSIVRFPFCPLTSAPPVQWQQRRLPQWHRCPGAQLVLHPRLYHHPGHQFVNFRPSASHRAAMPKTSYNMFPLLYRVTAVDLTSARRTECGSRPVWRHGESARAPEVTPVSTPGSPATSAGSPTTCNPVIQMLKENW